MVMLTVNQESQTAKGIVNQMIMKSLEEVNETFSVQLYLEKVSGNDVWQGICKVESEGRVLAATSSTYNLRLLAGELANKILIQLPKKYFSSRRASQMTDLPMGLFPQLC